MEHLTLPSVGASFKKWGCCTPIFPKAHSSNFPKKNSKKKIQKKGTVWPSLGDDPRLAGDCWSSPGPGSKTRDWRPLVARLPATSG
jgi:hypothetical protein